MNDVPADISKITPHAIAQLRAAGLPEMADRWEAAIAPKRNKYLDQFTTQDPTMLKMKEHIIKLMEVDDPVMIIGESGTGKELIANALHNGKEGKFIAINCAGMPEQLIESELFGHEKGAFTGADKQKNGLLNDASDGTIFLDEIGEMPMLMQAKLLRAIQEKKVRRVGGSLDININCRFVCATHQDIENNKMMRIDLFYRLSTFILRPSPLCTRMNDIELILKSLDKDNKLPASFLDYIMGFNARLKGNVRSLQQMVRRYYVLGEMP